jgi:hypothetical protein
MAEKHHDVDKFMEQLDYPRKAVVELLRVAIRSAQEDIEERIKWNAPSFGPGGEDRVTFNLRAKDKVQLIFHRGAKAKPDKSFKFIDSSGMIEWITNDRGMVTFNSLMDAKAKEARLIELVQQWVEATP